MAEIYGHAWVSQYGAEADAGSMWAASIAGLSMDQLSVGIKRFALTSEAFPPTTGEFRAACLDIPSVLAVELELQGSEVSPFTMFVVEHLNLHHYRSASVDKATKLLRTAYDEARTQHLLGAPLPVPMVELDHVEQPYVPADPAVVADEMAKIAAVFNQ